MAAKKTAAKSRTSKKSSSKTNLKWWYVLPVIAIVAVAGYAIVRFSEAGTAYKSAANSGLRGGTKTINKAGTGDVRVVGNTPVSATWGSNERGTNTKFCAVVYIGNPDEASGGFGTVNLTLREGGRDGNIIGSVQRFNGTRVLRTICTNSISNAEKLSLLGGDATLVVSLVNGYASVSKMFLAQ